MKRFDKRLKRQLKKEAPKISAWTEAAFDEAINKIRAENLKRKPQRFFVCAAVAMALLALLLLNFKTGHLDERKNSVTESNICSLESATEHKKIAEEPQIEEMESIRVGMIDYRNPEIKQYMDMIFTQFKKERREEQKNPAVNYEVIANTEQWFALRVIVQEEKEDAVYYYNVNKKSGCIVRLSDLFVGEFDYIDVFSAKIKAQMKEEMDREASVKYWIDSDMEGGFYKIDKNQEFYFNQKGNLVIVFGKGEVAPEEMGYPRFVIEKEVYEQELR